MLSISNILIYKDKDKAMDKDKDKVKDKDKGDINIMPLSYDRILSLSIPDKITLLKQACEKGVDVYYEVSRVLLNEPIDRGGLPTEVVQKIFEEETIKNFKQ